MASVTSSQRTLTPVGGLVGAKVFDSAGDSLGTIVELMVESGTGEIVYAAVSVGGVLGVGERLFAVPWATFTIDPEDARLTLCQTRSEVEATAGFKIDRWPTEADPALRR